MSEKKVCPVSAGVLLCILTVLCGAATAQDRLFGQEENSAVTPNTVNADQTSVVQNAVLEGIQISSEDGQQPSEKIITCYFIFRDKPTSYFYESKSKENKLIFEFNDTEVGVSPIPSMKEPPVQGFRVEPTKVDVNAEVKGLKPEWHDVIRVSFYLDAIPEISVKDEYSVISYSFTWSTDPAKQKQYIKVDEGKKKKTLLLSIGGGVGAAAAGGILWYVLKPSPPTPEPPVLSIDDLPDHKTPY